MKTKKLKNIFRQQIQSESLFQQEQSAPFKVGQHQIRAGWLSNLQKQQYIYYVNSSLKLAQLQQQLQQLKQEGNRTLQQSPSKANMFKIATLKKKINNFQLDKTSDITKINTMVKDSSKQKSIQAPKMDEMIVQKISGVFNTSYLRKCKLQNKILKIQSKKNTNEWASINLESCTIQLEMRDSPLKKEQFINYTWVENYYSRLQIKQNNKLYCIYGPELGLKILLKYLKFSNIQQTFQGKGKKPDFFAQLNKQYQQKIIALFGKKVRYYQSTAGKARHLDKQKKNGIKGEQNKGKVIFASTLKPMIQTPKSTPKNIENHENSLQNSQILFSPELKHRKMSSISAFRLRGKRGTLYYDELNDNLDLSQIQHQSPVYRVQDINLNLRQEIGESDVDQSSQSQKQVFNRKRTTNISVSGKLFHKPDSWKEDKFSINIHQISSGSDQSYREKSRHSSKHSSPYNSGLNQYENNYIGSQPQLPRHSTSSLSSFQLQQIADRQSQKIDSNVYNIIQRILTPRSFNTTSSNSKSNVKSKRLRFCFRQRQLNLQGLCVEIQMLYPYNKQKLQFSIIQLDPDIEMQKYKVICSRNLFEYQQNKIQGNSYMSYVTKNKFSRQEQKKKNQNSFEIFSTQKSIDPYLKLSKDSDQFIFILKEQGEEYYLPFSLNVQAKYQVDQSQIILIENNQETKNRQDNKKKSYWNRYKFAALMHLYISPYPIQVWNRLSTVQFIKQYIQMSPTSPHYQFKQNFINRKRRIHTLKQKINYKVAKTALQMNDQKTFQKAIFKGIPQIILKKMQSKLKINNRDISKYLELNAKQIKMLQETIVPATLYDLRVFMKPIVLIQSMLHLSYNAQLKNRFEQLVIFCLYKTGNLQNFLTAFMKEVLLKLQRILLALKTEFQVVRVLQIYFLIQYEIDELFQQISKYF